MNMPRDATILIRLTKEEKAQINSVAQSAGESISVWVRQTLREKAGINCQETSNIAAGTLNNVLQNVEEVVESGLNSPVLTESSPVNGEPPLDIPEIPLNDPQPPRGDGGPFITEPSSGQGGAGSDSSEPPIESGYWLDGEWVPD